MVTRKSIGVFAGIVLCATLGMLLSAQTAPWPWWPTYPPMPTSTPQVATPAPNGNEAPTNLNRGDPFPNLTADELTAFLNGKDKFTTQEQTSDGVGPIFNERSCGNCHNQVTGGGSAVLETRFGRTENGVFDPLANLGGSLQQVQSIQRASEGCFFPEEVVPPEANTVAKRRTTSLFGMGLIDSLTDQMIMAQAASEPAITKGKVIMTLEISTGLIRVGKLGWKAQVPTLHQFSGDAYLNEMGITNPDFPLEHSPNGPDNSPLIQRCNPVPGLNDNGEDVDAFFDFMRFLAPSPRGPIGAREQSGETLFTQVGCAACHKTTWTTPNDPNLPTALRNVTFHPYSDFLVHDMGSLGDGIVHNNDSPTEMRTAPLWGTRFNNPLLHDGRVGDVTDAIRAHDGQGKYARDKFFALPQTQQEDLKAFLRSL